MAAKNATDTEVTAELLYGWAEDLFPIHRSLSGPGVRKTLHKLQALLPGLKIRSIPSGTKAFDWTVPNEWIIREAYIENQQGERIVDIRNHNLHVVGYSCPMDEWMDLEVLDKHLHSIPEMPEAIPYVTSYYARNWGFCLSHRQRQQLPAGRYRVVIDSDLKPGELNYGELILPGAEQKEVLLSTYICHPSMANDNISGAVVTAGLALWLASLERRRYSYRLLFIPETIGSIHYLSRHLDALRENVIAGYVVTCVGDERCYSYVPSRDGDTLADRVAKKVLSGITADWIQYSFLDRGSDERQYCSPGVDLPVALITRSKFGCYPEYHTSLDDLSVISPAGLFGSFSALQMCIQAIEKNYYSVARFPCEPQLGKRNLYTNLSRYRYRHKHGLPPDILLLKHVLAYADGSRDIVALAEAVKASLPDCMNAIDTLASEGLLEIHAAPVSMPLAGRRPTQRNQMPSARER